MGGSSEVRRASTQLVRSLSRSFVLVLGRSVSP